MVSGCWMCCCCIVLFWEINKPFRMAKTRSRRKTVADSEPSFSKYRMAVCCCARTSVDSNSGLEMVVWRNVRSAIDKGWSSGFERGDHRYHQRTFGETGKVLSESFLDHSEHGTLKGCQTPETTAWVQEKSTEQHHSSKENQNDGVCFFFSLLLLIFLGVQRKECIEVGTRKGQRCVRITVYQKEHNHSRSLLSRWNKGTSLSLRPPSSSLRLFRARHTCTYVHDSSHVHDTPHACSMSRMCLKRTNTPEWWKQEFWGTRSLRRKPWTRVNWATSSTAGVCVVWCACVLAGWIGPDKRKYGWFSSYRSPHKMFNKMFIIFMFLILSLIISTTHVCDVCHV